MVLKYKCDVLITIGFIENILINTFVKCISHITLKSKSLCQYLKEYNYTRCTAFVYRVDIIVLLHCFSYKL